MSMICTVFSVSQAVASDALTNPAKIHQLLEALEETGEICSLEKSWHGLHFILTGSAWAGPPPLNILVSGGVAVGEEDIGYGPARVVNPESVTALNAALTDFSEADFTNNFNPARLKAADIYPQIWDESLAELKQEYWGYLQKLKKQVQRAAASGQALIVAIW